MRNGVLILASCVVVGVVSSRAAADDAPSHTSLTDPISTAPSAATDDSLVGRSPSTNGDRFTLTSALNGLADSGQKKPADASATPKKDSHLIHAEYRRHQGSRESDQIQQVTAKPSLSGFDDADGSVPDSPARVGAANRARRVGTFKSPAAIAELGASGPRDASQAPALTLQWLKKSNFTVGQECLCDLVVKNAGRAAARDVAVDAYFPATVRLTQAEPMPTDNQDHVTWSFRSLAPGEEHVIHVKMIPSKRGELPTTALVRFTHAAPNVFVIEEPLLGLSMHGPKDLMVGDPATQSITVNNPGTGTAHNVTIEARVTKGLEHPRGERLLIHIGSLNPGESRMVRLPLVAVAGGPQTIAVRAMADNELHQELLGKLNVIAPSVKVAIDGPSLRYVGRNAAYVITVTNDGGAPTNNVRITHKLPEGFRFARADRGAEYDEATRTISWFIGRLEMKESILLKVELATTQIGAHVHTVTAVSEQGARSEAKFETVVDGTASLEVEIIDLNDPVEVGTETAYEIHVRNDGSKAASNVAIACQIPAELEMLRAEGATPGRNDKGLLTFRPLASLGPGKAAIYRVYVKGRKEGNHRFKVRLSGDSIKDPLIYEEMTKFYAE